MSVISNLWTDIKKNLKSGADTGINYLKGSAYEKTSNWLSGLSSKFRGKAQENIRQADKSAYSLRTQMGGLGIGISPNIMLLIGGGVLLLILLRRK